MIKRRNSSIALPCGGKKIHQMTNYHPTRSQNYSHLHEDEILRQQKRGNLREFAHRGRVRVRYHRAQLVERIVQVVHAAPFARVDVEPNVLGDIVQINIAVNQTLSTYVDRFRERARLAPRRRRHC